MDNGPTKPGFINAKPYSWALVAKEGTGRKITMYKGKYDTEEVCKAMEKADLEDKFQLMDLPPELRLHILGYLPDTKYVAVFLPGRSGPPTAVKLPTITKAGDELLRQEAIMVTIEQTTFAIHSGPGNEKFQRWLGGVDLRLTSANLKNGFDAVKSLDFPYFSRFPHYYKQAADPNQDLELATKCGNLTTVGMTWVGGTLETGGVPKAVAQLRTEYRLDRLLGCDKLEKIELKRMSFWPASETAIQALATWLRTAFPVLPTRKAVTVVIL